MARKRWDKDEETLLLELIDDAHGDYPNKTMEEIFQIVADEMDERTSNAVRDRYYYLTRQQDNGDGEISLLNLLDDIQADIQESLNDLEEVEKRVKILVDWVESFVDARKNLKIITGSDYTVQKVRRQDDGS